MDVVRVKLLTTLKSGSKIWDKGTVLDKPFDAVIRDEIRAGSTAIEVLRREGDPINVGSAQSLPAKIEAIVGQKDDEIRRQTEEIDSLKILNAQAEGRINILEENATELMATLEKAEVSIRKLTEALQEANKGAAAEKKSAKQVAKKKTSKLKKK